MSDAMLKCPVAVITVNTGYNPVVLLKAAVEDTLPTGGHGGANLRPHLPAHEQSYLEG
jgi:hypothetical protein